MTKYKVYLNNGKFRWASGVEYHEGYIVVYGVKLIERGGMKIDIIKNRWIYRSEDVKRIVCHS